MAVEDLVQRTFEPADAPDALIVYVGQRPEYVVRIAIIYTCLLTSFHS